MHTTTPTLKTLLAQAVNRQRLLSTATELIAVPSRTGEAGAVLDRLADLLSAEGFAVERRPAGHPSAPAVLARLDSGRPGPTIQFNGHLDTVHLPFVPPGMDDGRLTGSGASDMKGGTAAAGEARSSNKEQGNGKHRSRTRLCSGSARSGSASWLGMRDWCSAPIIVGETHLSVRRGS